MSLKYRLVADFVGPTVIEVAYNSFQRWITERKGISVDLSLLGRQSPRDGVEVSVEDGSSLKSQIVRLGLHEETSTGRWSTTLTAMNTTSESWVWLDLEHVSEDPWGAEPVVQPPRLVHYLLESSQLSLGPVALWPVVRNVTDPDEARSVANLVLGNERTSPLVVLSHDYRVTDEEVSVRAKIVGRQLAGIAPVFVLSAASTTAFNEELPETLRTFGGAARTYFPATDDVRSALSRHRVLGSKWFANPSRAAKTIAAPLVFRNLAARPPASYREEGRALIRSMEGDGSLEQLLADTLAAEASADAATTESSRLQEDLEWSAELMRESEVTIDKQAARIRYLEAQLSEAGQYLSDVPTPLQYDGVEIGNFDDVIAESRAQLPRVVIGDVERGADALDQYPQASSWARRTWQAMLALQGYAEARSRGWTGDFKSWCREPETSSSAVIQESWVALLESNTVDNNAKYRSSRVFGVPTRVDARGEVYMASHIKIVQGGRPAPRVHFWDDTNGTGKIYIGYVGPHLPNGQTN
ncbi:hypothetical protein [Frigoribacterium sp. RIT-PI-h]|uniref:hypothetical protein n=1 Tax=Frigoribacterium sp. RIT-PI-h TaxID=1690245 RepID=UPI000AC050A0|nr:hypothetical protein [Frigoribacterium sp. RIT-PI-h]